MIAPTGELALPLSSSVTVTVTEYVAGNAYACESMQEPLPAVSLAGTVLCVPSPHENVQVCVSRVPASVKFALTVTGDPTTVPLGPVTLGQRQHPDR